VVVLVEAGGNDGLVPDLKEAIPRSSCHCHTIFRHTQAANAVIVAR